MSIARYLQRSDGDAIFIDSRDEPPGLDELKELWADVDVRTGATKLPGKVDRIIVSPGIADSDVLLERARKKKLEVLSDIELFAREAEAPFAVVTGSNGKSTVTTLLYHMCHAAGRTVLAGGNLGEPALDLLAEEKPDIYVLELSSFQLQRTDDLPAEVAVLLNVSPDHLDWHASEDEYRDAKYRIYREAKTAVINRADEKAGEAAGHIDNIVTFGLDEPEEGQYGIRSDDDDELYLACGDTLLIAAHDIQMVGTHNRANALAALAAGDLLGLDMGAMLQVLTEFPGLPHRMQFVARKGAVDYWRLRSKASSGPQYCSAPMQKLSPMPLTRSCPSISHATWMMQCARRPPTQSLTTPCCWRRRARVSTSSTTTVRAVTHSVSQ
jgi:UDP-N-acetylmuramoylalanine--D-glutamate ligase